MGLGAAELTFLENGRGVPISRGCQSLGSADTLCEKAESKVNPCHVLGTYHVLLCGHWEIVFGVIPECRTRGPA